MTAMKPLMIIACECGSDTFWLTGVNVTAVCTGCGKRTPLGVTAFQIRGVAL